MEVFRTHEKQITYMIFDLRAAFLKGQTCATARISLLAKGFQNAGRTQCVSFAFHFEKRCIRENLGWQSAEIFFQCKDGFQRASGCTASHVLPTLSPSLNVQAEMFPCLLKKVTRPVFSNRIHTAGRPSAVLHASTDTIGKSRLVPLTAPPNSRYSSVGRS